MDSIANRELELAPLSTNDVAITRNLTRKVVSLTRRFDTSARGYNVKGGGSEPDNLIFRKENETWILTSYSPQAWDRSYKPGVPKHRTETRTPSKGCLYTFSVYVAYRASHLIIMGWWFKNWIRKNHFCM